MAVAGAATCALAGTLAGCGGLDAKLQAHQASSALQNAKVAAFTLHVDDPAGELSKLATSPADLKDTQTLVHAALRVTVDPAGDRTIGQLAQDHGTGPSDPVAALKASGAVELDWTQSGKQVAALRLVDGVAYARLDLAAFRAATGQEVPVDQLAGPDAPAQFATVVDGLKAGKWLSIDLAGLYRKADKAGMLEHQDRVGGLDPSAVDPKKVTALVHDLLDTVQAQSVTSESAGKDQQVTVSVSVKAKQALLAALDVIGRPQYASLVDADGTLPASLPGARAKVQALPDTPVTGAVLVQDGHVRQASVDLASLVALGKDAKAKQTVRTARVVVDVDDAAPALTVPAADQVVQVDPLVDLVLGSVASMQQGAAG